MTDLRCEECNSPVTKERPVVSGPLAALAAKLPIVCDRCVARMEAEDQRRHEADAERERTARIAERVKRSGLPEKYHGLTLSKLDHRSEILLELGSWHVNGGGLLLTGEIGRGKTTLAGAACWHRLQRKPVQWTSAPLLFARLGSGLGSEQRDQALGLLSGWQGLVLDDIDKARPTEYGAEQMFLAIDQRIEHEAPLLVTSNLAPSQLAEKWPEPYGPAIASRLVGYCKVVPVEGVDRRLRSVS